MDEKRVKLIDDEDKGVGEILTPGGNQNINNVLDLYK